MSARTNYTEVENVILQSTCKYLNTKKLASLYEKYAINLYRQMDPNVFKGYKLSKIAPIMGKLLGDKVSIIMRQNAIDASNGEFDLHEHQKLMLGNAEQSENSVNSSSTSQADLNSANSSSTSDTQALIKPDHHVAITEFMGINDLKEFKMLFNPESMYVHYYVVLDSSYRDTTEEISTNITKFRWSYAPTQNLGTGFCNSVGTIRDIIGMRMYQPKVPYVAGMNTNAKRVSVLIEEFAPQAFIAQTGRRFHFLLRPNYIDGQTSIELSTEDYNDGIFNFRKPITTFDTLTISFGDPLTVLSFATPFDRFMIPFEFVCLKSD